MIGAEAHAQLGSCDARDLADLDVDTRRRQPAKRRFFGFGRRHAVCEVVDPPGEVVGRPATLDVLEPLIWFRRIGQIRQPQKDDVAVIGTEAARVGQDELADVVPLDGQRSVDDEGERRPDRVDAVGALVEKNPCSVRGRASDTNEVGSMVDAAVVGAASAGSTVAGVLSPGVGSSGVDSAVVGSSST